MKRIDTRVFAAAAFFSALLMTAFAHAAGVSVATATPAELNEAKGPYAAGVKAMNSGLYEEAANKFKESYDIVSSPNSRLMLGRALVRLNRLVDAYREFQETVAQAMELTSVQKKYEKTAASAKKELEDLQSELAFVTVIPGTDVSLAGRRLSAVDWGRPQAALPGTMKVEIKAADGRMREKELVLEPGVTKVLSADLTPTASYRSNPYETDEQQSDDEVDPSGASSGPKNAGSFSRKQVGYVSGGVGAFGVVSFLGLTLMAESIYGDPLEDCDGADCSRADVRNAGSKGTLKGMSYIALSFGVVGLGAGAYLILTDKATANSGTTALRLGPGRVGLQTTF